MDDSPGTPILTSVFELFKPGPGPSSSHTIAPMAAARQFREFVHTHKDEIRDRAASVRVRLFGSLSATGPGHGTEQAVAAGLLGFDPADCPPGLPGAVFDLPAAELTMEAGTKFLPVDQQSIVRDCIEHGYPYNNTIIFELRDAGGGVLLQETCFSVGGGFVLWQGREPEPRPKPALPYANTRELITLTETTGLSLARIVLLNEMSFSGLDAPAIHAKLDSLLETMRRSVQRGISTEGILPGTLGVYRKAAHLARKADALGDPLNRFLGLLNAYAFAVAEENAAGGIIVTAPTCGASGVIPAILTILEGHLSLGPEAIRNGLLAAAAVGFLAKNNAAIAGAEVGCQGEIGVASAMAAAMLAEARGYPAKIVENAAEIALEHHLGLTCDPVGGYVQIPCIERNAMGALKAYNACLVAITEDAERHRVDLDAAIKAMAETGRDMNSKYKETSLGGLAVCLPEC